MTLPPTMGQLQSWWHPSSISLAAITSSSKPGSPPLEVQLLEPASVSSSLPSSTDGWMQFLLWLNFTWDEGALVYNIIPIYFAHAWACRTSRNMPRKLSGSTVLTARRSNSDATENPSPVKRSNPLPRRTFPPFMPTVDVPRGILYAFQRLMGFGLMLSVM